MRNTMRHTIPLLLVFWTFTAFGQNYPFAKGFVPGTVVLKDNSLKSGQVKWLPNQNEKLKFRETGNGEITKYSPEEIAGFSVDTLKFISLFNFYAYADNYALVGKTSYIEHTFGQTIDTGKFNIYFVLITGYNAITGAIQSYPNFLFQDSQNNTPGLKAYPYAIRMKDKKYERAKIDLYALFKDYPDLIDMLKNYDKRDDFFEIINRVKAINRQ